MKVNYHTHTARCRHASGTEREYIETAIARGLDTLGFSDHTPYIFPDGYYSGFRMFPEQAAEYFETLEKLKKEYSGKIRIFSGLEAEYYPKHFPALLDFLKDFRPDYLILGQHFTKNEYDGDYSGKPTDNESVIDRYVKQVIEGLETGCFTYLAHPDLIRFTGRDSVYEKHMSRLCESCRELSIPIEINMLGLMDNRHYPSERFWKIAAGCGCDIVIGCDAHKPDAVAEPATLKKAHDIAERVGVSPTENIILRRPC